MSATAADKAPSQQLIKRLLKLQKKGVMIGHQDDPVYGTSWHFERNRSDVKEVCGDYPAVFGFDLGKIELESSTNIDGVSFDRMREEIIEHHMRGGIITLSWHAWNPVTGENSWDASGNAVSQILPKGSLNNKFNKWLNSVAIFINSLKTPKGKAIPVIFRPWHEMSGSWFWWGSKSCTPEEYKNLYKYTYNYMQSQGCTNIVWAYSPNLCDNDETEENYLKYYPGNDYIDLIGIDVYQFSADNTVYQANIRKELNVVKSVGQRLNKIIALTETGYQNTPDSTWYTKCLLPLIKEYPISYVLLWRNAWNDPKENYIAAPGKATEKDFVEFYKDKTTLFLNDIK